MKDPKLKELLAGVINRQMECICIDSYANAFNDGPTGGEWMSDDTEMRPEVHERKWEIDSLCYPIRLAYQYWKVTGDISVFGHQWVKAMEKILATFRDQQRMDGKGTYRFQAEDRTCIGYYDKRWMGKSCKTGWPYCFFF